jgi:hypothetical protein
MTSGAQEFWRAEKKMPNFKDVLNASSNLPNKSLQPTATAVTPPAAQEIVPAVAVAEH